MNRILYLPEEIAGITGAKGSLPNPVQAVRTLLTDSRKLTDTRHGLFFALQGRRNGHRYIDEVYQAGVRNFIISDPDFKQGVYTDANFYLVNNVLTALHDLAAFHRKRFNYPVIGITGSNGKTIVKEWLYQLMAPEKRIVRSPKSYNSQIGVPLSVWEMNDEYELAIFEAGISRPGEMENLERVIQPTIGILTNIGEAHNEGFESSEQKLNEKLKLFKNCDLFIYSCQYLPNGTSDIPGKEQFTWCYRAAAQLEVFDDEVMEERFQFLRAHYANRDIQALVPLTDYASIENAITCWATMLAMGYDAEEIDKRIEKLQAVKMRLELKNGKNNCSIIDDSYSCDISSLAIALDFLKQQNQHQRRTLVLSDIPGEGLDQQLVYDKVASLLERGLVDRLVGVGPNISRHAQLFKVETVFFENTEGLLNHLDELKFQNETILLKGARAFEFERVSAQLIQKVHETVLEINLNAMEHNLNFYRGLVEDRVKIMAMVKAFSYGSGSFEVANLLQFNKVDYLAVAYADEGAALRSAGISLPIMVMSPDEQTFDSITAHQLEPELFSFRQMESFIADLNRKNLEDYPVHIKIDTGMHRLGFSIEETDKLLALIKENKAIKVQSVFTHMVASEDESEDVYTREQIALFKQVSGKMEKELGYSLIKHMANTSGIRRWQNAQFDMVRLGIGLYGVDGAEKKNSPLRAVNTLKSSISQIRKVKAGDTVGYNRKGLLDHDAQIATVKIGYAADWSEYNAHQTGDAPGALLFNLDPLWADANIDFVGIDNYLPLADWRDGTAQEFALGRNHIDADRRTEVDDDRRRLELVKRGQPVDDPVSPHFLGIVHQQWDPGAHTRLDQHGGDRGPVLVEHQPNFVQHRRHSGQCGGTGELFAVVADESVQGQRQLVRSDLRLGPDPPLLHDVSVITGAGDQADDGVGVADVDRQQHG